jgi:hypothetical protein
MKKRKSYPEKKGLEDVDLCIKNALEDSYTDTFCKEPYKKRNYLSIYIFFIYLVK